MNKKQILESVKQYNWQKFLTRPYSVFFITIHIDVYYRSLKELMGINFKNFIYLSRDGLVEIYRDDISVKKVNDTLEDWLKNNRSKIDYIVNEALQAEKEIKDIIEYEKNNTKFTLEDYKKYYVKYADLFVRMTTVPFYLGQIIESKFDMQEKYFKDIVKKITSLRDKNYYNDLEKVTFYKYLKKIAKENDTSLDLVVQLDYKELLNNIPIDLGELKERKKHYVLTFFDGEYNIDSNKKFVDSIGSIISPQVNKDIDVIRGQVAYTGKVTGRVKIIQKLEDLNKMEKGDILVSISTNPELLPAMKKAAAIVTDEGGMITHAAIVAREFKIPCIVGTKVASKVLKDNDRIEVDANNGIVKKL